MSEMEIEAGKDKAAELPRPNFRLSTVALLALTCTLLLTLDLAAKHHLLEISDFSIPTASSGHGNHKSDRSMLSPEEHIFRNATTISQSWHVTSGLRRPDGVLKQVYLINGEFPGPTLEARCGDTLVIDVKNGLVDEGIAIHFHGLHMRGANDMDGAVGITQDPILPGRSFTYSFTIDAQQHGTFWYHVHEAVQRADGLFGGLVVHEPVAEDQSVADERLVMVGDWYHRSAKNALQFYMHPGAFGLETVPDSVLLNGDGAFNCSNAVPARPLDCVDIRESNKTALHLESGKRTVLRMVNVGAYAGIQVAVPNAVLTPLSVDSGHTISGKASKTVGFIQPGERVDVLIEPEAGQKSEDTIFQISLDDSIFKYENTALAVSHSWPLRWEGLAQSQIEYAKAAVEHFDMQLYQSTSDQSLVVPAKADQTIVLYTLTQKLARLENEPRGFINSSTWLPPSPPLLQTSRDEWSDHQITPHIPFHEKSPLWVDIVLNNLDEDSHPFHLHGHNFWVLTRYSSDINWGSYNPYEDHVPPGGEFNIKSAAKKDTVYVPRRGYAVLRFRADNPGIWAFHCHVLWHEASGMAMAFDIS